MSVYDRALKSVFLGLGQVGIKAFLCVDDSLPDIIVVDSRYGLVAADVYFGDTMGEVSIPELKKLVNRRIAALREEFDIPDSVAIRYKAIKVATLGPKEGVESTQPGKNPHGWLPESQADQHIPPEVVERITRRLNPQLQFAGDVRRRTTEVTSERTKRAEMRFRLDRNQAEIARFPETGPALLFGPAGSGKTLVLVARAKLLATENPNWTVRILCFNNALKPYLEDLVSSFRRITVETFYEYTQRTGHRFSFKNSSESYAMLEFKGHERRGIDRTEDAVLVDEVQDFYPAWIKFLNSTLRSERGGLFLAGSEEQSLYRDSDLLSDFSDLVTKHFELERPYRSTKQILEVVDLLFDLKETYSSDSVPNGELPDLIYVPGGLQADHLAEAIFQDILHIYENYLGVQWGDFGILGARAHYVKGLAGKLRDLFIERLGINHAIQPVFSGLTKLYKRNPNQVSLMTIHSSKGLEFRFVFLVGLEEVAAGLQKAPKSFDLGDIERESKLNLVGPTRAQDKLSLYYSRDNLFLARLARNADKVNVRRFPEDYSEVK